MRTNYAWLRASARYHRTVTGNLATADHFDSCADELREAHVAKIVAQNPGIDEAEVRASFERTSGVEPH